MEGGHNIPEDVIERRYVNGIKNLFDIYIDIVDRFTLLDASTDDYEMIATKSIKQEIIVFNNEKFNKVKSVL